MSSAVPSDASPSPSVSIPDDDGEAASPIGENRAAFGEDSEAEVDDTGGAALSEDEDPDDEMVEEEIVEEAIVEEELVEEENVENIDEENVGEEERYRDDSPPGANRIDDRSSDSREDKAAVDEEGEGDSGTVDSEPAVPDEDETREGAEPELEEESRRTPETLEPNSKVEVEREVASGDDKKEAASGAMRDAPTPPDEALARELAGGRPKRTRRRPQRWEAPAPQPARPSRRSSGGSAAAAPLRNIAAIDDRPSVLGLLPPRSDRRNSRGGAGGGNVGGTAGGGTNGGGSGADVRTISAESIESSSPPPGRNDPVRNAQHALGELEYPNNRAAVNAFHTWQLRAISEEANYQKLLHAYLRRRLRKRSNRAVERERVEEDALRNACSALPAVDSDGAEGDDGKNLEDGQPAKKKKKRGIDELQGVAPDEVRLPLESYFPRRVRKADSCSSVDHLIEKLPKAPKSEGIPVWNAPAPNWACLAESGEGKPLSKVDCLRLTAPVANKPKTTLISDDK